MLYEKYFSKYGTFKLLKESFVMPLWDHLSWAGRRNNRPTQVSLKWANIWWHRREHGQMVHVLWRGRCDKEKVGWKKLMWVLPKEPRYPPSLGTCQKTNLSLWPSLQQLQCGLMFKGYAIAGVIQIWVTWAATQDHGSILSCAIASGLFWVHGTAIARVCVDVYGTCDIRRLCRNCPGVWTNTWAPIGVQGPPCIWLDADLSDLRCQLELGCCCIPYLGSEFYRNWSICWCSRLMLSPKARRMPMFWATIFGHVGVQGIEMLLGPCQYECVVGILTASSF